MTKGPPHADDALMMQWFHSLTELLPRDDHERQLIRAAFEAGQKRAATKGLVERAAEIAANTEAFQREDLKPGRDHLTITGKFQSDKYLWCPAGFVPLKTDDAMATDLLVMYAYRRTKVDEAFGADLLEALGMPARITIRRGALLIGETGPERVVPEPKK